MAGRLAGRLAGWQVGKGGMISGSPPSTEHAERRAATSLQRAALASHAINASTGWNGTPFPYQSEQAPKSWPRTQIVVMPNN